MIEAQEMFPPDISEEGDLLAHSAFLRKPLQLRPQNPIAGKHKLNRTPLSHKGQGTDEGRVIFARG
jgi:hypothetical protein